MPSSPFAAIVVVVLTVTITACDASAEETPIQLLLDGKTDVGQRVELRDGLEIGSAVSGQFDADLEFHGYPFVVAAGSEIALEVTHKGSSSKLDTTLFLFGPRDPSGHFGAIAPWFDDDSGWGRLSELEAVTIEQPGEYLAVVGTADGRGRGHYRLELRCEQPDCTAKLAESSCHPVLLEAIAECIEDTVSDPESMLEPSDALEMCADAEPLAPVRDAICLQEQPAPEFCDLDIEGFFLEVVPVCRQRAEAEFT